MTSASIVAVTSAHGPQSRLIGTWRYDKPSKEVLAAIERRSNSIQQRDRLTRAAHELQRVTRTYDDTHRTTQIGAGSPFKHRYEVVSVEDQTVRLRLFPASNGGEPFEETLTFINDSTMRHVIDGVPRTLRRQ